MNNLTMTENQPMSTASVSIQPRDRLLTLEELPAAVGDLSGDLVRGRFVAMPPTGRPHARTEVKLASKLEQFVSRGGRGEVLTGEIGIIVQRDPDTVRGADILFVSNERLRQAAPEGYLDVAPELVVEIVSPNDRWSDINEKLEDYFGIGVLAVWLIDPKRRRVHVYRSPTEAVTLGLGGVLSGGEALPGFEIQVDSLFES